MATTFFDTISTASPSIKVKSPKKPILGTSFSFQNKTSDPMDFDQTGNNGFIDNNGQLIKTGFGPGNVSGYNFKTYSNTKKKRERDFGNFFGGGNSSNEDFSGDKDLLGRSKKQKIASDSWPIVTFADGATSIGLPFPPTFGMDTDGFIEKAQETPTEGFKINNPMVGERVQVVPADGCVAPGQYEIIITSKYPFIGGFDVNSDPTKINDEYMNTLRSSLTPMNILMSSFDMSMISGHTGQSAPPRMGFNLASFNYWIAHQQRWSTLANNADGDRKRAVEFKKHFNLINDFVFHGIANSEVYANNGSSFMNDTLPNRGVSMSATNDKALNIVYEGEMQMQNYYGPVPCGTPLYLIWKKIKRPVRYITNRSVSPLALVNNPSITNEMSVIGGAADGFSEEPFQLVPYADPRYREVPLSELEFKSDHIKSSHDRKHMGVAFKVGIMLRPNDPYVDYGTDHLTSRIIQANSIYDMTIGQDDPVKILVDIGQSRSGGGVRPPIYPMSPFLSQKNSKYLQQISKT